MGMGNTQEARPRAQVSCTILEYYNTNYLMHVFEPVEIHYYPPSPSPSPSLLL